MKKKTRSNRALSTSNTQGGDSVASQLTARQQFFASEYASDLNATRAAIRAGYSAKCARVQGHRLLTNAAVQAAITEANHKRVERADVAADRVLIALRKVAFFDLRTLFDGTQLREIKDWPEDARFAVASYDVTVDRHGNVVTKLRFNDRLRALELLGRHLKLFTDKVEHSGSLGIDGITAETVRMMSDEDLAQMRLHARAVMELLGKTAVANAAPGRRPS